MRRVILLLIVFVLPFPLFAEEPILTRRDGFLLIWESIRRPSEEVNRPKFTDIQEGDEGFQEISYAADRGILDDDGGYFIPEGKLMMDDALLWLMRTRNVADLSDMQKEDLPTMLQKYPIFDYDGDISAFGVSQFQLIELIRTLDTMMMEEVHNVSYYADYFHGKGTAFGETFDMYDITAAHRTMPVNTLVEVTNIENQKKITVRINDRGPYVDGRDMDLSMAAFEKIADHSQGVLRARFKRLGDEELIDVCTNTVRRYQKRITNDVRFHRGIPHSWNVYEKISLGANRWFVVRGVTYPDGSFVRMQDYVGPKDRFHFTPSKEGDYIFKIGTIDGREREFRMEVHGCTTTNDS
ncbi:MAG: septal ring lytic transglycosylase RlpA family protein [Kiritimatiellales bacterium]|nr:septal ring lytic transglycosylase RlpA family protein [Kiritimatiellales bacterium]